MPTDDIKHENDDLAAVDPLADEHENHSDPADNSSMMIVRADNTLAHDHDIGGSLDNGDDQYESITEIGAQFKLIF